MPQLTPPRFRRDLLCGRARRNLVIGCLLAGISLGYGIWSTGRLATRGAERAAFDRPVVRMAASIVRSPDDRPSFTPATSGETFLLAVVTDQQDLLFGLTLLVLRLLVAGTAGGLGMVLLTAGATEWEVRTLLSHASAGGPAPVPGQGVP